MTNRQETPLVTAIITTYNRPEKLKDAVDSVLSQTYDRIELIVIDDCSETLATAQIGEIDTGSLPDVKVIRHDENRGANAARNTGINAASGKYVAFLDDDDTWRPTKLARQVEVFEENPNVGVVYTGIERVLPDETNVEIPPEITGDMTKELLCRNVVGTMSVVMVRAQLAQSVPLDDRFPCWADLEWYISLSKETKFQRVTEPLVIYECEAGDRLSRDFEKTNAGYELFVDEFDALAAEYGTLFRRKMHAWAAYRTGKTAFHNGLYDRAQQLFNSAIRSYPFEPKFIQYFLASLGDQKTHELAKKVNRISG